MKPTKSNNKPMMKIKVAQHLGCIKSTLSWFPGLVIEPVLVNDFVVHVQAQ